MSAPDESSEVLRLGDTFSLYVQEDNNMGFYSVNSVDHRGGITTRKKNAGFPPNFSQFLFKIQPANQYIAHKKFHKEIEKLDFKEYDFRATEKFGLSDKAKNDLEKLQLTMEAEKENNLKQIKRLEGRTVTYAQVIQLVHVPTGKYLTISRESAELHKDCLKIVLTEAGGPTSYFHILPYFKYKIEGEPILYSDQIKLWSKKFNLNLRACKGKFWDGRNEVNMSPSLQYTKWGIAKYSGALEEQLEDYLKAGNIFRIFHKEKDGYLMLKDDSSNVEICDSSELSERGPSTIWQIEKSDPSIGGVVSYSDEYKIRHVSTGKYLASDFYPTNLKNGTSVSEVEDEEINGTEEEKIDIIEDVEEEFEVTGEDSPIEDDETPFKVENDEPTYGLRVFGSNEDKGEVWYLSAPNFTKEKNVLFDTYLCLKNDSHSTWLHLQTVNTEHDRFTKVQTTPDFFEEDVFSFKRIPRREVHNLLFVNDSLVSIKEYSEKIEKGRNELKNNISIVAASEAFIHLIRFVSDSTEMDPFKREGIPILERQLLIREKHLLDYAMRIIGLPFEKNFITQDDFSLSEFKEYYKLIKLAYKFIKLSVKSNLENGEYMYQSLDIFQNQIGWGLGSAQALIHIIRDNIKLLHKITEDQIQFFIEHLQNSSNYENTSLYVTFLSALCDVKNQAISKNQDFIGDKLLKNKDKKSLLYCLYCEEDKPDVYVDIQGKKINLESLIDHPEELENLTNYFYLLSKLCLGRNQKTAKTLRELINFETILKALESEKLPASLKASLSKFLEHCHVITADLDVYPLLSLTRKWQSALEKTDKKQMRYKKLKIFIEKFLEKNKALDVENQDQNSYIRQVLWMTKSMVQYGIYHSPVILKDENKKTLRAEIITLITNLFEILDGSSDVKNGGRMNLDRFKETEGNIIIGKIKTTILEIYQLIFDNFLNNRITKIIQSYRKTREESDTSTVSLDKEKAIAMELLKDTDQDHCFTDKKGQKNLISVLLDLTKYENSKLSINALQFLFRFVTQKEELNDTMEKVELLVSEVMVNSYDNLNAMNLRLANLYSSRMGDIEKKICLKIIKDFIFDIKESGQRSQRIMRNLGVHELLVKILKSRSITDKKIHRAVVLLLIQFVTKNRQNQTLLFDHFEFLLSKMNKQLGMTKLISEIIRDNRSVVSQIEEKHVQILIDSTIERMPQHKYLDILSLMVVTNGYAIKRNQMLITKSLLDRRKDILILFEGSEGLKERNDLIQKKDDETNPNGKLAYHIHLLELFASCSDGTIYSVEVKLQSLFSIEDNIAHILDSNTTLALKIPLMRYLDEVYVNVEIKTEGDSSLNSSSEFWKILEEIPNQISKYVLDEQRGQFTIYLFGRILPMLDHYFSLHFRTDAPSNHISIIQLIFGKLQALYSSTANPQFREKIVNIYKTYSRLGKDKIYENYVKPFLENLAAALPIQSIRETDAIVFGLNEENIISQFKNFTERIQPTIENQSNFSKLSDDYWNKNNSEYINDLVRLLMTLGTEKQPNEATKKIVIRGLRTLIQILEKKMNGPDFTATQNRLCDFGVCQLILQLVCSEVNEITEETLELGKLILENGNDKAQKIIYDTFLSSKEEKFFFALRIRIRKAVKEIKERKEFLKKLKNQKDALIFSGDNDEVIEFKEEGFIESILRFLQLFCEGHNLDLQNYIRQQPDNFKSINLVQECLEYTLSMKKYINSSTVDIAYQAFQSLTEFIQGPCIENQLLFNNTQLYYFANDILSNEYNSDKQKLTILERINLKKELMILLNSIIGESYQPEVYELMTNSLDIQVIISNLKKITAKESTLPENLNFYVTKDTEISALKARILEEEEELGYQYYYLLNFIASNKDFGSKTASELNDTAFSSLKKNTGKIEVIRDNKIETVFFQIPELCSNLSKKSRDKFVDEDVNRSTAQTKVTDLLTNSRLFEREMKHTAKQKKNFLFSSVINPFYTSNCSQYFGLFLAFTINLIIFLSMTRVFDTEQNMFYGQYTLPIPGVTNVIGLPKRADFSDIYTEHLFIVLGWFHLSWTLLVFALYLIFYSSLEVKLKFPKDSDYDKLEWPFYQFATYYLWYLIQDRLIWLYIAIIVGQILSLTISPLFYSLLMFEMIYRFKPLQYILQSVWIHKDVLLLTGLLLLATIWFFSSIIFNFFNQQFFLTVNGQTEFICDTMFRCYLMIINYGLRGEGFWEDLFEPVTDVWRLIFDLVFWICVVLILMNIVFSTILESFAEIREEGQKLNDQITNTCFICDIERNRFEIRANEGIRFDVHIKNEHYMWNYVYFFIHVWGKEQNEYTGIEQYISDQLKNNEISFFPVLRSSVLEDSEKREKNKNQKVYDAYDAFEDIGEKIMSLGMNQLDFGQNK
eukprot:gene10070-2491_t